MQQWLWNLSFHSSIHPNDGDLNGYALDLVMDGFGQGVFWVNGTLVNGSLFIGTLVLSPHSRLSDPVTHKLSFRTASAYDNHVLFNSHGCFFVLLLCRDGHCR